MTPSRWKQIEELYHAALEFAASNATVRTLPLWPRAAHFDIMSISAGLLIHTAGSTFKAGRN